jgi:nitroreductase
MPMNLAQRATAARHADHAILPLFLERWSPRAMDGRALSDSDMHTLFEAARWAPSTQNEQEWRFLYARPGSPHWQTYLEILMEGNRTWCKDAGLLCLIVAAKTFAKNGKPNPVYSFDAGSAFMSIALQGAALGLVVHGMAGFEQDKARRELAVPRVICHRSNVRGRVSGGSGKFARSAAGARTTLAAAAHAGIDCGRQICVLIR